MDSKKIYIKNFWLKNYKLKDVFFKDRDKKYIKSYLSRQNYIKYDLIKKNSAKPVLVFFDRKYGVYYEKATGKKLPIDSFYERDILKKFADNPTPKDL